MADGAEALSRLLRTGLASPTPGALLGAASMLLAIAAAPGVDPASTGAVVRGLAGQGRPEASAGALAVATLAGDESLRRWARRDLADRGFFAPQWLALLHRAVPSMRALEVIDPFRDIDDLLVGVALPTGHCITAVARLDNELRGLVIGGALFERPVEEVPQHLERMSNAGAQVRDIEAADARAGIEAGLRDVDPDLPLTSHTELQNVQPLVRWMLSRLPAGGEVRLSRRLDDADLDDCHRQFVASPWGRPWGLAHLGVLVENVLGDGLGNGLGDPLLWAPHHVARLLDPTLRCIDPDDLDAYRTPELLRDLIRYGHAERGVPQQLTDRSLREVDRRAPAFLRAVRARADAA